MNFSIYSKDSCSRMEAAWSNLETTDIAFKATHYVNPIWNNLAGKTIILTLPTNLDLERLTKCNKVISRYPLNKVNGEELRYEYIPYPDVEFKPNVSSNYSNRILNRYLLTSENFNITDSDRFLLGTEPETNGVINTIGYLLLRSIKTNKNN